MNIEFIGSNGTFKTREADKTSYLYQAFNLQTVIAGFKALNGSLNKIRIYGYTNHKSYETSGSVSTARDLSLRLVFRSASWVLMMTVNWKRAFSGRRPREGYAKALKLPF